jgi:hypothetical protein
LNETTNDLLYAWRDGNHKGFSAFGFFHSRILTRRARGGEGESDDKRTLFHGFGKTDTAASYDYLLLAWAQDVAGMLTIMLCVSYMPDYPFSRDRENGVLLCFCTCFSFRLYLILEYLRLLLIKRTIPIYCYFPVRES